MRFAFSIEKDTRASRSASSPTTSPDWKTVANSSPFARGALTGMLLHDLCWTVQQQGRSFSATQGRQPSRLRGEELFRVFEKGIGLLMNLEKEQLFNCRLLPFLRSLQPESRRDAFNSGLICGMVYYEKKSDDNKEVKHD